MHDAAVCAPNWPGISFFSFVITYETDVMPVWNPRGIFGSWGHECLLYFALGFVVVVCAGDGGGEEGGVVVVGVFVVVVGVLAVVDSGVGGGLFVKLLLVGCFLLLSLLLLLLLLLLLMGVLFSGAGGRGAPPYTLLRYPGSSSLALPPRSQSSH